MARVTLHMCLQGQGAGQYLSEGKVMRPYTVVSRDDTF